MKIFTVIGARPQFIKEAAIQNVLKEYSNIKEIVVHTGQHYDKNMSGIFFDLLNMKVPDYNLGIKASKHGEMTGKMLVELEKLMIKEKPDVVLLHGDTNSTLAGAISASKLKIPIAHVEAGVRQAVIDMPEEINRVLTDRISTILFSPSQDGLMNLEAENNKGKKYFVGNIMYDIFKMMKPKFNYTLFNQLHLKEGEFVVITLHRDFNVDKKDKLQEILEQFEMLAKEKTLVFPMHPRTQKRIKEFKLEYLLENIKILPPINYLELMGLAIKCDYIITDSGGFQCEAYFAKKRAIVIMDDTGWIELVNKFVFLTPASDIYRTAINTNILEYEDNIYGDGTAAIKIVEALLENF